MHTHRTSLKTLILALALTALSLLAGCGGGNSSTPRAAQSASAVTPEGLTATLAADQGAVARGGSVTYTLTLTNNTAQPITYETEVGCPINAEHVGGAITVSDATGAAVFPPPDGTICQGYGTSSDTTLAPGQSVTDTFTPSRACATGGLHAATASFLTRTPGVQSTQGPMFKKTTVGPITVDVR